MKTLKNVLLINAISSGASGVLLILFPGFISGVFGINTGLPFLVTGVILLLFSFFVYFTYAMKSINTAMVNSIIYMDEVWVVSSFIIVFMSIFKITLLGKVLILGVALWVALMAFLQFRSLRRWKKKQSIA